MKVTKYLLAGALMMGLSGSAFAQEVNYMEALKPISEALNADPENPKAAKDLVKDYLKVYKKDAAAIIGLGATYLQVHNFDKATEMADLVLANKKMNQSDAYVLLGDIAALQDSVGNAGAAATQYQTAISIDPHNVSAYERYARVYRHVNPQTAVEKLEELRKVKPDYPVEIKAAEIMLSDQKYAEAAAWFEKANPSQLDEIAYYQFVVAEFYSGNSKKALQVSRDGLKAHPGSEYLSRLAVMAAVEEKAFPEALTYSENVMRGRERKNFNDWYYYGQALAGNNKFQEAIKAYNMCLELKADNAEPLAKLAAAYKGLGDGDNALKYQRQYLDKSDNVTTTDWADLASIYVGMGDQCDSIDRAKAVGYYNEAMGVYETMTEKFPSLKDWCWVAEASVALGKLKDLDKVSELYKRVAAFEEAKTEKDATTINYLSAAYYFLGYYYMGKNDTELGKSYFEKLLQIDPNNVEAKKTLGLDQAAE